MLRYRGIEVSRYRGIEVLRYPGIQVLRYLPVTVHVVDVGSVSGLGRIVAGVILLQVFHVGELLNLFRELLYLGCDLLHKVVVPDKVVVPAGLALVGPGGDPGARWCVPGYLSVYLRCHGCLVLCVPRYLSVYLRYHGWLAGLCLVCWLQCRW